MSALPLPGLQPSPTGGGMVSWSTDCMPPPKRLTGWRNFLAGTFPDCDVDYDGIGDEFWASLNHMRFGDVGVGRITGASRRAVRGERQAKAGRDGAVLCISAYGRFGFRQAGRDIAVDTGDGYFVHNCLPGDTFASDGADYWLVSLPAKTLVPHFGDSASLVGVKVERSRPELRLLTAYVQALQQTPGLREESTRAVIGKQLADLVGTAVGRAQATEEIAAGRGQRAARYNLARAQIAKRYAEPLLNGERIARALELSERYVQRLFEENGTTVSTAILDHRLKAARRALSDPSRDAETIAAIAFACGFSDASHFNRSFRRRYGETPGDVRTGKAPN